MDYVWVISFAGSIPSVYRTKEEAKASAEATFKALGATIKWETDLDNWFWGVPSIVGQGGCTGRQVKFSTATTIFETY